MQSSLKIQEGNIDKNALENPKALHQYRGVIVNQFGTVYPVSHVKAIAFVFCTDAKLKPRMLGLSTGES